MANYDRFISKVNKDTASGCWEWTAAMKENGYGMIRDKRDGKWVMEYAHRYSWRTHRGEIPSGMYVCHSCDNRKCVNHEHLWLGTHQQNQADMAKKGRVYSHAKKLSDVDVILIREALARGELQREIAIRFGVQRTLISRIKTGARRRGGV